VIDTPDCPRRYCAWSRRVPRPRLS